jgi:hypothetical protein
MPSSGYLERNSGIKLAAANQDLPLPPAIAVIATTTAQQKNDDDDK